MDLDSFSLRDGSSKVTEARYFQRAYIVVEKWAIRSHTLELSFLISLLQPPRNIDKQLITTVKLIN